MESDFYLRYYVGHKGKFGHEFLEFEFRPDGERSLPAPRERGLGLGAGEWGGWGSGMDEELEEGTDGCEAQTWKELSLSAPQILSVRMPGLLFSDDSDHIALFKKPFLSACLCQAHFPIWGVGVNDKQASSLLELVFFCWEIVNKKQPR